MAANYEIGNALQLAGRIIKHPTGPGWVGLLEDLMNLGIRPEQVRKHVAQGEALEKLTKETQADLNLGRRRDVGVELPEEPDEDAVATPRKPKTALRSSTLDDPNDDLDRL